MTSPNPMSMSKRPQLTLLIGALLGSLAVVGAMGWRHLHSGQTRNALVTQMYAALDLDRSGAYRDVLDLEEQVAQLGTGDEEARSLGAYAAAILALEHHEADMGRHARRLMAKVAQTSLKSTPSAASTSLHRAAEALMVWADGDAMQAKGEIAKLEAAQERSPYEVLEMLRLEVSLKLPQAQLTKDADALMASLKTESRAWMYLGFLALSRGDLAVAGQHFARVRQISPQHERAQLGEMWLALGKLRAQQDTQALLALSREVDTVLSADALSPPERSMALMVRARAEHLGGEAALSARDVAEARQLDANNPLLALEDVLPR